MEIKFNIEKSQRKALAQKIAEISGNTVKYLGAPTFSYQIGNFMLNKDSVLTAEAVDEKILAELANAGFHYEVNAEPDKLTVQMPLDSLSERTLNRVRRIIENKGELFKAAFKTDCLEFQITEKTVDFPWFTVEKDGDADAYCTSFPCSASLPKTEIASTTNPIPAIMKSMLSGVFFSESV